VGMRIGWRQPEAQSFGILKLMEKIKGESIARKPIDVQARQQQPTTDIG